MGNVMKKLLQVLASLAVVVGALLGGSSAAWASPCAAGEKIVGKTGSAWLCLDIATGVIREQPF